MFYSISIYMFAYEHADLMSLRITTDSVCKEGFLLHNLIKIYERHLTEQTPLQVIN
jgi:hypothetical protein